MQSFNHHASHPGPLLSGAFIILQTNLAKKLFFGKPRGAVGVGLFSKRMTDIWQAAAEDDPYADKFLMDIYQQIGTLQDQIKTFLEKHTHIIYSQPGVELNIVASSDPLKIPLHFSTPRAKRA